MQAGWMWIRSCWHEAVARTTAYMQRMWVPSVVSKSMHGWDTWLSHQQRKLSEMISGKYKAAPPAPAIDGMVKGVCV
jgi:hypothetical protein